MGRTSFVNDVDEKSEVKIEDDEKSCCTCNLFNLVVIDKSRFSLAVVEKLGAS